MKFIIIFPLCAVILLCTSSCKHQLTEQEKWEKIAEQKITYWQGRTLPMPDGLPVVLVDSFNWAGGVSVAKLKMVTYVDGTCGTCVANLQYWKKFISEVRGKGIKCDFIFYINATDKEEFQRDVINKLDLHITWIYDKENKFITMNEITDPRFQTALLDKDNKVILLGTMLLRPELEELYKKTMLEKGRN